MKRLIMILLMLPVVGMAQIRVLKSKEEITLGKVKMGGAILAQITYTIEDKDTTYTFMYRNNEYKSLVDYKSIIFSGENNTLNIFYTTLKSIFTDENKKNKDYKVEFKLGSQNVMAANTRLMGITSVSILPERGYVTLSEKQVDKVFGKD